MTSDYKIEIKFDQTLSGRPYYNVFLNGQSHQPNLDEYKEIADALKFLSFVIEKHVKEMEETAQVAALKDKIENLDVNQARRLLSDEGKRLWVDIINAKTGGHGYTYTPNGEIVDVPMEGVWR